MEVARYFMYKGRVAIYALLALALSFVLSVPAGAEHRFSFVLPIWLQLLFARTLDDFFDYEKDDGRSRYGLEREALRKLCVVTGLVFAGRNLLLYGGGGFWSLGIVLWLVLEETFAPLQNGAAVISAAYYLGRVRPIREFGRKEFAFFAGLFVLSLLFGVWKRKRRNDL